MQFAFVMLLALLGTAACAQDRDDDDEDDATKAEAKDKNAEKSKKKAERKSRKEKKEGKSTSGAVKMPAPPATPPEFEFFDGAIFSRKVNLGIKNVLCFASERRPLAVLWKEAGQEGSAAAGNLLIKLAARELQLIFGRQIEAAQVSVLNKNGAMVSRGAATQVSFNLSRQPIYLLVETTPSRPKASAISADGDSPMYRENLTEVRVYSDPQLTKGARAMVFANLTQQVTIQILVGDKVVFAITNPGAPIWKWDGHDQNRQPLPEGKYQYRIISPGGSAGGVFELKDQ